jgi:SAM-dependent methyltransferase
MHEFWTLLFGDRLLIAPVENPKEILDIGCGTGLWASDVADEFSQSQVYGIDLSPVQLVYVAPNCSFRLENVLRGSTFHDEKFDLIQSRCIGAGISDDKWPPFIAEIWRLTKPGGGIQLIEMDPFPCWDAEMPQNANLTMWKNIASRVLKEKYQIIPSKVLNNLGTLVQNGGFVHVNQYNIKTGLGKHAPGHFWATHTHGRGRIKYSYEMYRRIHAIDKTRLARWNALCK